MATANHVNTLVVAARADLYRARKLHKMDDITGAVRAVQSAERTLSVLKEVLVR